MMTKAAFFMQEHLRRNFAYISDLQYPSAFFCRGRLPFPQGLAAMAVIFHNKTPADVYAHPYFIEKQSDPSQPSPQLHITEEIQGLVKVLRGLRYMRDESSKLDDTMSVVTDYEVPVRGRLLYVQTAQERAAAEAAAEREKEERNRSLRHRDGHEAVRTSDGPTITFASSLGGTAATGSDPTPPPHAADGARPTAGSAEVSAEEHQALRERRIVSRAFVSAFMHGGGGQAGPSSARLGGHGAGSGASVGGGRTTPPSPTAPMLFPSASESLRDQAANYRFFKAVLDQREEVRAVSAPIPPPQVRLHEEGADAGHLFRERVGGLTVVYNPVETNDRTFSDLMAKLNEEEKVVKVLVVPTRHAWRQVQLWADAFPDATIVSSGPIPVLCEDGSTTSSEKVADMAEESARAAAAAAASGGPAAPPTPTAQVYSSSPGLQDFGGGVTGLYFPEVNLEAEMAREASAREGQQRVERKRGAAEEAHRVEGGEGAAAVPTTRAAAMAAERERLRQARSTPSAGRGYGHGGVDSSRAGSGGPADPADVLWSPQALSAAGIDADSAMNPADSTGPQQRLGGLRMADAHRVRDLSREGSPDMVELTPSILLIRVKGDALTDEYVMYDRMSKTLYCTDLFHGQYADLDPLNSWMCRAWFKFMKQGNHKRIDIVPRFKWRQVCAQGTLHEIQAFVDWLTRSFDIAHIVHSHGTPPFSENPADALRIQWDLDPLPRSGQQRDGSERRDPFFDWEAEEQRRREIP